MLALKRKKEKATTVGVHRYLVTSVQELIVYWYPFLHKAATLTTNKRAKRKKGPLNSRKQKKRGRMEGRKSQEPIAVTTGKKKEGSANKAELILKQKQF